MSAVLQLKKMWDFFHFSKSAIRGMGAGGAVAAIILIPVLVPALVIGLAVYGGSLLWENYQTGKFDNLIPAVPLAVDQSVAQAAQIQATSVVTPVVVIRNEKHKKKKNQLRLFDPSHSGSDAEDTQRVDFEYNAIKLRHSP